MDFPNLAGVATAELVEKIGGGNFSAAYINWSRTMNLLRTHAPGWLPELVTTDGGAILHRAPVGAFLLIRFRNGSTTTPEVPQAVMDSRNAAIAWDKITARDITDTHRRGVCMAAAMTFGLAYELWAKIPLESGYHEEPAKPEKVTPTDGAWDAISQRQRESIEAAAMIVGEYMQEQDAKGAREHIDGHGFSSEEKIALWTLLDSKTRAALKRVQVKAT